MKDFKDVWYKRLLLVLPLCHPCFTLYLGGFFMSVVQRCGHAHGPGDLTNKVRGRKTLTETGTQVVSGLFSHLLSV